MSKFAFSSAAIDVEKLATRQVELRDAGGWTELLKSVELTGDDDPAAIARRLVWLAQNLPIRNHTRDHWDLMDRAQYLFFDSRDKVSLERYTKFMRAVIDEFESLHQPTKHANMTVYRAYSKFADWLRHRGVIAEALKLFEKASAAADTFIAEGFYTIDVLGSGWYWRLKAHAITEDRAGNRTRAVELLKQALTFVEGKQPDGIDGIPTENIESSYDQLIRWLTALQRAVEAEEWKNRRQQFLSQMSQSE